MWSASSGLPGSCQTCGATLPFLLNYRLHDGPDGMRMPVGLVRGCVHGADCRQEWIEWRVRDSQSSCVHICMIPTDQVDKAGIHCVFDVDVCLC